jgi:hypothetical protein
LSFTSNPYSLNLQPFSCRWPTPLLFVSSHSTLIKTHRRCDTPWPSSSARSALSSSRACRPLPGSLAMAMARPSGAASSTKSAICDEL